MTTARHVDCTIEEYHARDELSQSQGKDLFEDPALFEGKHISHIYPPEKKRAWDTGTVAHACLMEPDGVDAVVRVIPREVLNAQGHRRGPEWNAWKEENAGYIDMKPEEFEGVRQMVANVRAHPMAGMLLKNAIHFEHTIIWQDAETGLPLRARPDMICEFAGDFVVPDFKTTRSVKRFKWDAYDYGYHRQQAMYSEAVEALLGPVIHFPFICVDKSPAYQCEVYTLSPRALALGQEQNRQIRRDYIRRMAEDDWHSDTWGRATEVDLPERAYR